MSALLFLAGLVAGGMPADAALQMAPALLSFDIWVTLVVVLLRQRSPRPS